MSEPDTTAALTLGYVNSKTIAQFIEPPVPSNDAWQDRRRLQLWCNRIEEAALRILDDHGGEPIGLVLCTREYFDQLQSAAPRPTEAP